MGRCGGGKWSQAAVFSINSNRNPPTSCTGFSDPSREEEEAAGEILFLQGSGYCLPGSDPPTQLTKVPSDPPLNLRRAARGFVPAPLDVYSWSPAPRRVSPSLPNLSPPHAPPSSPWILALRHTRHDCKGREGREYISHPTPSKNMLAFLSATVVNSPWAPQTRPCLSQSLGVQSLFWSGKGSQEHEKARKRGCTHQDQAAQSALKL